MKHIIAAICVATLSFSGISQEEIYQKPVSTIRGGIKVGFGTMSLGQNHAFLFDTKRENIYDLSAINISVKPSFGIFVGREYGWLYTNVNALYSSKKIGYSVTPLSTNDAVPTYLIENIKTLDLEVTGGILHSGFKFGVGPVFHLLAGYESNIKEMNAFQNNMRDLRMGFMTTVGYQWLNYSIDFRYEKSFWSIGDNLYYGDRTANFNQNPNILSITLGYAFLK